MKQFIFISIVLFWSITVSATLIEFEGVAPPGGGISNFDPYTESGFDFATNDSNFRILSNTFSGTGLTSSSGDYGFIQSPANIISLTNASATLFSIQSLDAGILFSGLSGTLDVVGNLFNGNTVNTSLSVNNTGSFQSYVFDNTWTNLQSIDFTLSATSNFLGIDNVQLTTVPLPAAAWLFATGLLGLLATFRKKTV